MVLLRNDASGNHQRLGHFAQRCKAESLGSERDGPGREIDLDLVSGDDRLFFGLDLLEEQLPDTADELGTGDAGEAVVERIAQVGLGVAPKMTSN